MFRAKLVDEHGIAFGPTVWVTGNKDEGRAYHFEWSEVLQAHAKPSEHPGGEANWPELIDNGVYIFQEWEGDDRENDVHKEHRFVVERAFNRRGYILHSIEGYLHGVLGTDFPEDISAWHVDVTGLVYTPDLRPVARWEQLEFTGVVMYGVHADPEDCTPQRADALRKLIGAEVQRWRPPVEASPGDVEVRMVNADDLRPR